MYSFDSVVRYSEIDANRHMTLPAILENLQNCCTFHSESLGLGLDFLEKNHRAWVLSSWQVVINRYPVMTERIRTITWPYSFKGFIGARNFKIEDEKGEIIAYANSLWVYLDTESGRPARVPKEVQEGYRLEPPLDMECFERKIQLEEDMTLCEPIKVQRFLIDTNQHVNNSKYVMIAEEYLPEGFKARELRVEYKKAAVLSDIICPKVKIKEHQVIVSLENENKEPYAIVVFLE